MIYDGISNINITLYPPARPSSDAKIPLLMDLEEEEGTQPLLTIGRDLVTTLELIIIINSVGNTLLLFYYYFIIFDIKVKNKTFCNQNNFI